ncbi:hypothetical protein A0H81_02948 [Grifola frondosa]|uniref:Reverse transcriptase domain-containing protein n=1 Tax=Grifola frondosa TaxID=5627 RepID=A0A1C7MJM6_GRIFR|nr:hypothetical protein A0H81_02948 [Grifola frondosa]
MNPPASPPPHFDVTTQGVARLLAAVTPARTRDETAARCFSRPFSLGDIEEVKAHIRSQCLGSARGADRLAYEDILAIPNEDLVLLFQECIARLDAPSEWLVAILTGVGKKGKDLMDLNGYRTIGLESCLLKMLTLLIDHRLREWADAQEQLPPSQNGFRAGHRTNNNAFILRTAIEKARSERKSLYVAFVDFTNVFPSVDQATLWVKLAGWGSPGHSSTGCGCSMRGLHMWCAVGVISLMPFRPSLGF